MELLTELQKYIQGEFVYTPTLEAERKGWGVNNCTREIIRKRNIEIYKRHKEEFTIYDLMNKYNLSEDSIRKIISNLSKEMSSLDFSREVASV